MKQFILGGARSGKSRLAETLCSDLGDKVAYIATANSAFNDHEMAARISQHQQQRPQHWRTIEAPMALAEALASLQDYDAVLIDCLTLWLSNCLHQGNWAQERQNFLQVLENFNGELIIVSNEVGMGIVPLGELSRRFVDESGFLHQAVAARCERVIFIAAGLPLVMKGPALTS
ncbi:bifunctional adenosylcobinamide kinase/adenosylcobinamide-phosphate guanylyltransferase [Oceanisphaera sp. W20_SRM_FM3]|uniref:bifunctional adenosylcobinamide kinase/adenosylcobinamide-phosphate guanylyltransferase n=1 Tax=Oceanisphaera sp. W20_SRM_FM3 TaxID=3240267 RepID=UPI003F9465BA